MASPTSRPVPGHVARPSGARTDPERMNRPAVPSASTTLHGPDDLRNLLPLVEQDRDIGQPAKRGVGVGLEGRGARRDVQTHPGAARRIAEVVFPHARGPVRRTARCSASISASRGLTTLGT